MTSSSAEEADYQVNELKDEVEELEEQVRRKKEVERDEVMRKIKDRKRHLLKQLGKVEMTGVKKEVKEKEVKEKVRVNDWW